MACVHYGLQQTTKDSDWVILPEDFTRFRDLLAHFFGETHPSFPNYVALTTAAAASIRIGCRRRGPRGKNSRQPSRASCVSAPMTFFVFYRW